MTDEQVQNMLPLKKVLQGSVLILISNLIYIGNNYLVAWTQLTAPEVTLVRGGLQVVIFGIIVWKNNGIVREINVYTGSKSKRLLLYVLVVLYGFTSSTMSFAALAAISLMPIGDLIVICFTSPVFSVFLERIVLKRTITFLSICLCLFIVLGDVLVVQPPFLFEEQGSIKNATDNSTTFLNGNRNMAKHGNSYFIGIALCFYVAAADALTNVLSAHCNKMDISTSHLMLVSGFSNVLLSLISSLFTSNKVLTDPLSLSQYAAILLPVSALITMIAYWTITLAVSITRHTTLISMLRSTEIPISLVTESLWWRQLPGTISLLGSLLVAACVFSMSAHDNIVIASNNAWMKIRRKSIETLQSSTNEHVHLLSATKK